MSMFAYILIGMYMFFGVLQLLENSVGGLLFVADVQKALPGLFFEKEDLEKKAEAMKEL